LIVVSTVILVALDIGLFISRLSDIYLHTFQHDLYVMDEMLTLHYENIVNAVRALLTDKDFRNIMDTQRVESPMFFSQDSLVLDEILSTVAGSDQSVQTILVVNRNGNIKYYSKLAGIGNHLNHYYEDGSLLNAGWRSQVDAAKGKEVFFGTNILYEDPETVSMAKALITPDGRIPFGYIIVTLKKKIFSTIGGQQNAFNPESFFIVDRRTKGEEQVVYYSGSPDRSAQILQDYVTGNLKKYIYAVCVNETSGWDIVSIVSKQELGKLSAPILLIAICVALGMIGVLMVVANTISRHISSPIEKMEKVFMDVGQGRYRVDEEFDDSEVGRLGNKFKNLVNNNLELHETVMQMKIKERESQLLLLQSQINPHFLYNTLDSLYFMAILENANDIAEMVQALSDMFKLSLNQGRTLISVRDEIKRINAYAKIQDYRYHGRFAFRVDVDEELLDTEILTFMLQPLVENAVYHGLEPKIGGGAVSLRGERKGSEMVFTVSDDGVGMSSVNDSHQGFSIRNIQERIQLYYGAQYGLRIMSSPSAGTTVVINLPYPGKGVKE
jgi:two-component system sensor histidine kinase YesM